MTAVHSTQAVWRFPVPLPVSDRFTIEMPMGAEVLTVQAQFNELQIWALVDPRTAMQTRHFRIAGTGHPIDENVSGYVGTFQVAGGSLVFHVFEVAP